MGITFDKIVPVLRSFDEAKAREFYVGFLGFGIDWEHRFEPGMPLYMQLSRGNMCLHLSEHHGDATPGACVFIRMTGLLEFHKEISAKNYPYARPGVRKQPWHSVMEVTDPFGNTLRFNEDLEKA